MPPFSPIFGTTKTPPSISKLPSGEELPTHRPTVYRRHRDARPSFIFMEGIAAQLMRTVSRQHPKVTSFKVHLNCGPHQARRLSHLAPDRQSSVQSSTLIGKSFMRPTSQCNFILCPILYPASSFHRCWFLVNIALQTVSQYLPSENPSFNSDTVHLTAESFPKHFWWFDLFPSWIYPTKPYQFNRP